MLKVTLITPKRPLLEPSSLLSSKRQKKFVVLLITWYNSEKRALFVLQGVLLPLCGEMMSFISYLQNWLIDTSESHTSFFSSLCWCVVVIFTELFCVAEIEQVDTQDCSELAYELVMQHQWPILSS
ncbi:hypothetical protein ACSBR2_026855 [Camellia fascicularis]